MLEAGGLLPPRVCTGTGNSRNANTPPSMRTSTGTYRSIHAPTNPRVDKFARRQAQPKYEIGVGWLAGPAHVWMPQLDATGKHEVEFASDWQVRTSTSTRQTKVGNKWLVAPHQAGHECWSFRTSSKGVKVKVKVKTVGWRFASSAIRTSSTRVAKCSAPARAADLAA